MTDDTNLNAYVTAALALHQLRLSPAQQTAVTVQFRLLAAMAQRYLDQPDSADDEPAPVYRL